MTEDCSIVSLSTLIEEYGIDETSKILSSYESIHDSETETFLKNNAISMEQRDLSRTYLAISTVDICVLGFVTIGIKCMKMPEENLLSNSMEKSMNIDARTDIVQSFIIGQLSRAANAPKGMGSFLLDIAFEMLNRARDIVGCRVVRLDCLEPLIPYYTAQGFKLITKNEEGDLNQMTAFVHTRQRSDRKGGILLEE